MNVINQWNESVSQLAPEWQKKPTPTSAFPLQLGKVYMFAIFLKLDTT